MPIKHLTALAFIAALPGLVACTRDEPADPSTEVVVIEESAPAPERPVLMASATQSTTARVEAIDHQTRVVTLLPEGGEPITLMAPEEAHNLDQIEVGDTISAEYSQSLTIEVVHADHGAEPSESTVVAGSRAEKGATPAGGITESRVSVSVVEAIDLENNTFKLKMPDGEVREFTARNPENLKLAKVGDAVVITRTETLAVALTAKAGAEPAAAPQE